MKKTGFFLVMLVILFSVISPRDLNAQNDVVKKSVRQKTTVGNNTYVQLSFYGEKVHNRYLTILLIIKEFEDQNKNLEIVNWKIEKQESAWDGYHVFGLWIQHKQKEETKQKPRK